MSYQSLNDIYAEGDAIRARFLARVAGITPEQATLRPSPEEWTPAELVEHLSIVETGVCRMLELMLAQAPAGDGFQPFSLEDLAAQAGTRKFKAPERVAPTGQVSLTDAVARLQAVRTTLQALRPRIENADLTDQKMPHPAFGPINGYQWLAFVGLHEMRHAAQLKRILNAQAQATA